MSLASHPKCRATPAGATALPGGLAAYGLSWLKRGRYWIAYDAAVPVIAGVFFDTDDIPNRLR